jgi:cell pole-organizing protein PopZ
MEDILASIRRILSEEEPTAAPAAVASPATAAELPAREDKGDDVLVLDPSMLVEEEAGQEEDAAAVSALPPPADTEPPLAPMPLTPMAPMEIMPPPPATLLAPETAAAATSSVGNLMRTLATERTLQVHRGGPTIEDIVREELRPLLKQWLDANLPDLVERLVRAEIERVVGRAVP